MTTATPALGAPPPRLLQRGSPLRFRPRLPGQAVDGIGQYVYPARFGEPTLESLPKD